MILGFVSSRPVGRSVDKPISARGALLAVGRAAGAEAEAEATTPEVSAEGTTEAMMSPREGVNVRIRGHGETTLQEKVNRKISSCGVVCGQSKNHEVIFSTQV